MRPISTRDPSIGFFGIKGGIFTLLTGGIKPVGGADNAYFSDNNLLAVALLMTIPLMRYLQLTSGQRVVRWGLMGAILAIPLTAMGMIILAEIPNTRFIAVMMSESGDL